MIPRSLSWVQRFQSSVVRALDGDLILFSLTSGQSPMEWWWVATLQDRTWTALEIKLMRILLKGWCEANDAIYQRSEPKEHVFRALIYLRHHGREMNNAPW